MKVETVIFAITTAFFILVSGFYWWVAEEPAGTVALFMTGLLAGMVALYLGTHARKMEPRPEDRKDGEIADGAGELGFFPPYSWWPLWCALVLGVITTAVAYGAWWLFGMGLIAGVIVLSGWIFEYYRGEHAH
jgi:hypothetical protein